MLPIRHENAYETYLSLFSSNIFNMKPHAQTIISLNASTRCENDDVQRVTAVNREILIYSQAARPVGR